MGVLNSVNAHAEELRSSFVAHEGKKQLTVTVDGGDRYTVDFGYMAELMTTQIHENVRIPSLKLENGRTLSVACSRSWIKILKTGFCRTTRQQRVMTLSHLRLS